MRLAQSLCAFTFVTAAMTFSPSKVRDLDDASGLFTSDEPLLLADTSDSTDGTLEEFPDDIGLFNPTSPLLDDSPSSIPDDIVASNSIDSSCQNPARKRDFLYENPLVGRCARCDFLRFLTDSPCIAGSALSCPIPSPLSVPDLSLEGLENQFQGSRDAWGLTPNERYQLEQQQKFENEKPWYSIERMPFSDLFYEKEHWCDQSQGPKIPVCCISPPSVGAIAHRCKLCTYFSPGVIFGARSLMIDVCYSIQTMGLIADTSSGNCVAKV